VPHALQAGERGAERLPDSGVLGCQVQALGGVAQAHRGQRHAFQLEGVHDLVEAAV
jgi:hypothetical protein